MGGFSGPEPLRQLRGASIPAVIAREVVAAAAMAAVIVVAIVPHVVVPPLLRLDGAVAIIPLARMTVVIVMAAIVEIVIVLVALSIVVMPKTIETFPRKTGPTEKIRRVAFLFFSFLLTNHSWSGISD